MAGIDKIYGYSEQYDEFYTWVNEHKPELLKFFYERPPERAAYEAPLTNFPEWADKWLLKNCPLQFVLTRIKEQYNIQERDKGGRKQNYVPRRHSARNRGKLR